MCKAQFLECMETNNMLFLVGAILEHHLGQTHVINTFREENLLFFKAAWIW